MNTFGIDPRVWKAVVGSQEPTPDLVALAASMCPEVANDGMSRKEWDALSAKERDKLKAEISFTWEPHASLFSTESSDIASQCNVPSAQVRNALAQWTMAQRNASDALESLGQWDRKLGVWCACAVAETVLQYVPAKENAPGIAIKTARDWVEGYATDKELEKAADRAQRLFISRYERFDDNDEPYVPALGAMDAARSAALGASPSPSPQRIRMRFHWIEWTADAASRTLALVEVGDRVDSRTFDRHFHLTQIQKKENRRLREVVAGAIMEYAVGGPARSSRGLTANRTVAAGVFGVAVGAVAMHLARRT